MGIIDYITIFGCTGFMLSILTEPTCDPIKGYEGCACELSNSQENISLKALVENDTQHRVPRFVSQDSISWNYGFQPCGVFSYHKCINVSALRYYDEYPFTCNELGVAATSVFNINNHYIHPIVSNITLKYQDQYSSMVISLVCNDSVNPQDSLFSYIATEVDAYYFALVGKCCCPGGCDGGGKHIEPHCDVIQGYQGCACELSDSQGNISLKALVNGDSQHRIPRFVSKDNEGWKYGFHPCGVFSYHNCTNVSALQYNDVAPYSCNELGSTATSNFSINNHYKHPVVSNITLTYRYKNSSMVISLVCNDSVNPQDSLFNYIATEVDAYYFALVGKCCCPGGCDGGGKHIEPHCDVIQGYQGCACELSDLQGNISLKALVNGDSQHRIPRFVSKDNEGWKYGFHPCGVFSYHNCTNVSALQYNDVAPYSCNELGSTATSNFSINNHYKHPVVSNITLTYRYKNSSMVISLVCNDSVNPQDSLFNYIATEVDAYYFALVGKCCCPGGCDGGGKHIEPRCDVIQGYQGCACELSDLQGNISLKALVNGDSQHRIPRFVSKDNEGWKYGFHPCGVFSYHNCTNVSALQYNDVAPYSCNELGSTATSNFSINNHYKHPVVSNITLTYRYKNSSMVISLVCNDSVNPQDSLFNYIATEVDAYYFALVGKCCCPGGCDGGGKHIEPRCDVIQGYQGCACELSDLQGNISLKALVNGDSQHRIPRFVSKDNEGWKYGFHPCGVFSYHNCTNVSALQYNDVAPYSCNELGSTATSNFSINNHYKHPVVSNITLTYRYKNSSMVISLVCNDSVNPQDSLFNYIATEVDAYYFALVGKCCCPGGCDGGGKYIEPHCDVIQGYQGCACELSDSQGNISLKALVNGDSQHRIPRFVSKDNKGWKYGFHPCGVFSYHNCTNVSALQYNDVAPYSCNELGSTATSNFSINNHYKHPVVSNITLTYRYKNSSMVISLVCNDSVNPQDSLFNYIATEVDAYYFTPVVYLLLVSVSVAALVVAIQKENRIRMTIIIN